MLKHQQKATLSQLRKKNFKQEISLIILNHSTLLLNFLCFNETQKKVSKSLFSTFFPSKKIIATH
jgi:hypothetical protein